MTRCRRCSRGVLIYSERTSRRERRYQILMPVEFYACIECGWRVARITGDAAREWIQRIGITLLVVGVLYVLVGLVVHTLG